MTSIEIPFAPSVVLGDLLAICERHDCAVERTKDKHRFKITTADPANLYWLGSNMEAYLRAAATTALSARTVAFGDFVRAKCSAPARAIGNGKCVYVSAMCNDLSVDDIDMAAEWENGYDLPLPSDGELQEFVRLSPGP
jgi:hypothetical protein